MLRINEFLPNPDGPDAGHEWVELYNGGTQNVNLTGWRLQLSSGKKVPLSGQAGAGGFSVFNNNNPKFTLRNTEEKIFLYDPAGNLTDSSNFLGTAPSGKSWSRMPAGNFVWATPTPGKENHPGTAAVAQDVYPFGQTVNAQMTGWGMAGLLLGVAGILTAVAVFIIKRNENLSKLFFGGN